jgi:hypothetical protein
MNPENRPNNHRGFVPVFQKKFETRTYTDGSLEKQARAAAAGGRARCHGWLEWRSHGLPSLVLIK